MIITLDRLDIYLPNHSIEIVVNGCHNIKFGQRHYCMGYLNALLVRGDITSDVFIKIGKKLQSRSGRLQLITLIGEVNHHE